MLFGVLSHLHFIDLEAAFVHARINSKVVLRIMGCIVL